jgi:hypothetical protein
MFTPIYNYNIILSNIQEHHHNSPSFLPHWWPNQKPHIIAFRSIFPPLKWNCSHSRYSISLATKIDTHSGIVSIREKLNPPILQLQFSIVSFYMSIHDYRWHRSGIGCYCKITQLWRLSRISQIPYMSCATPAFSTASLFIRLWGPRTNGIIWIAIELGRPSPHLLWNKKLGKIKKIV